MQSGPSLASCCSSRHSVLRHFTRNQEDQATKLLAAPHNSLVSSLDAKLMPCLMFLARKRSNVPLVLWRGQLLILTRPCSTMCSGTHPRLCCDSIGQLRMQPRQLQTRVSGRALGLKPEQCRPSSLQQAYCCSSTCSSILHISTAILAIVLKHGYDDGHRQCWPDVCLVLQSSLPQRLVNCLCQQ
jgi:hypothetical protein